MREGILTWEVDTFSGSSHFLSYQIFFFLFFFLSTSQLWLVGTWIRKRYVFIYPFYVRPKEIDACDKG